MFKTKAKPEAAPLKQHVQTATKERKEEREGGEKIGSSRFPEAGNRKTQAEQDPTERTHSAPEQAQLVLGWRTCPVRVVKETRPWRPSWKGGPVVVCL